MSDDLPPGPYDLLYADPPLAFKPRGRNGDGRSPQHHYPCIPIAELCAMPVPSIMARDSMLAIWAYGPRLPETLQLIEAWGYHYVSCGLVWVKTSQAGDIRFGTGYYTRKASETLLLAKRGAGLARQDRGVCEVFMAPRRSHSSKPAEAAERLERLFGPVRRLEMFGRGAPRPGWDIWGDEAFPPPLPRQPIESPTPNDPPAL